MSKESQLLDILFENIADKYEKAEIIVLACPEAYPDETENLVVEIYKDISNRIYIIDFLSQTKSIDLEGKKGFFKNNTQGGGSIIGYKNFDKWFDYFKKNNSNYDVAYSSVSGFFKEIGVEIKSELRNKNIDTLTDD